MFQLALRLGYASPSRMMREMRPSEYGIWMALWRAEPWDEERADLRSALVALQVSRSGLKKTEGAWSYKDFMPFLKSKEVTMLDKLRGRFAGRIVKRKK